MMILRRNAILKSSLLISSVAWDREACVCVIGEGGVSGGYGGVAYNMRVDCTGGVDVSGAL